MLKVPRSFYASFRTLSDTGSAFFKILHCVLVVVGPLELVGGPSDWNVLLSHLQGLGFTILWIDMFVEGDSISVHVKTIFPNKLLK
jgi:hypothetical protein